MLRGDAQDDFVENESGFKAAAHCFLRMPRIC
jgi:hypothetical protein